MNIGKAVVFDLDGTLLDTLGDICAAVNHVMSLHGLGPRSETEVRSFVGNGAKRLIERSIYSVEGELDVEVQDQGLAELCFDQFKEYYNAHINVKTMPYAGILELLERLDRCGVQMAVVSNKPEYNVKQLCDAHAKKYIKIAVGDKEGQERKPDPTALLKVIEELGCHRAIYVGDSEVDVKTARNAGIPCVSVCWGFRDKQVLLDNGAEILVDDVNGLAAELSKLLDIDLGDF